jgi:hypothetical protein
MVWFKPPRCGEVLPLSRRPFDIEFDPYLEQIPSGLSLRYNNCLLMKLICVGETLARR